VGRNEMAEVGRRGCELEKQEEKCEVREKLRSSVRN